MGYTTKFDGQFTLDRLPPAEVIVRLNEIHDDPDTAENNPGSYCQWELTKDCMHLRWDCGEKFYNYTEWLQYLIDTVLAPAGISLSGTVKYQGEQVGDTGTISVVDGKAIAEEVDMLAGTIEELRAFKKFVLESDYADDLLEGWERVKHKTVASNAV